MLSYFSYGQMGTPGFRAPPALPYMRDMVKRNLSIAMNYYSGTVRRVASNHPLVSLIKGGSEDTNMPYKEYMEYYMYDGLHLGTNFGFTTPYNVGKAHAGVFFNGECYEYISLYTDGSYSPTKTIQEVIDPVVFLDHGKTSVNFSPPYGMNRDADTRAAYIAINLTGLMDLFYKFCELQKEGSISETLGIEHFVAMYVIPRMIASYTNIAIINRTFELDRVKWNVEKRVHPFSMPDIQRQLDNVLSFILSQLRLDGVDSKSFFKAIPSFLNQGESARDSLRYPKDKIDEGSVSASWFYTAARMRFVDAMIKLNCRDNGGVYQGMVGEYRQSKADNYMKTGLKPVDLNDQRSYRGTLCVAAGVQMFD